MSDDKLRDVILCHRQKSSQAEKFFRVILENQERKQNDSMKSNANITHFDLLGNRRKIRTSNRQKRRIYDIVPELSKKRNKSEFGRFIRKRKAQQKDNNKKEDEEQVLNINTNNFFTQNEAQRESSNASPVIGSLANSVIERIAADNANPEHDNQPIKNNSDISPKILMDDNCIKAKINFDPGSVINNFRPEYEQNQIVNDYDGDEEYNKVRENRQRLLRNSKQGKDCNNNYIYYSNYSSLSGCQTNNQYGENNLTEFKTCFTSEYVLYSLDAIHLKSDNSI